MQRPNQDPNQQQLQTSDMNQITIEYDNVILNLPNNQILNVPIEDSQQQVIHLETLLSEAWYPPSRFVLGT